MKNIFRNLTQVIIFTFLLSATISVSAYEKDGVIEKEFNINANTRIEFTNKSSDLTVKIWNKQAVKLECFYKLKAKSQEDIDLTLEALEHLEVNNSSSLLEIKTNIFSNVRSTMITGLINRIVATLATGPVVNLTEYEISYILTLPDNHDLKFYQKYSDVNIPDYSGDIAFDLYDVDLRAGQTPKANLLKAKYSNLTFGSLGNCDVDIYDTDMEIGKMGNLKLKSKYSKFKTDVVGTVLMDSYDDKLFFYTIESIKGKAKYTDLEIGDIQFGDLDLYDCDLNAKDCGKLKIAGKYSGIVLNKVDVFEFPDCYDNKVEANFIGEFSTNSKYTEFIFGHVAGMIDFETYDDKLTVGQIDKDFYMININGKYAKVNLTFTGKPRFFVDVDFKYTNYDLPKNILYHDIDTKSGKFIASGRTEGLKASDEIKTSRNSVGIRKSNIGRIKIIQYDGTLSIKN